MASENVLPWILNHRELIKEPILETGAKQYKQHSSLNLRHTVCRDQKNYMGCDLKAGSNVDITADITADMKTLQDTFDGKKFSTIFCISVLEHIPNVFAASQNISELLEDNGVLFLSVPFIFRYHGYPGDYWRFTPEAIRYLFPDLTFDQLEAPSTTSTLESGDIIPLPEEFKVRNEFNFRPKSRLARKQRKLLKRVFNGRFVPPYSLAPTMINMIGFKKKSTYSINKINELDELRSDDPLIPYEPELSSPRIGSALKYDQEDSSGLWQFEYLKKNGLESKHRLLEIGCGGLRAGQHLIPYLNSGNYSAADPSRMALEVGWQLLSKESQQRKPHLYWGGDFSFNNLGEKFNFAWAHSVFTHLSWNAIGKCLFELRKCIEPGGSFFATYFAASNNPWEKQAYGKVKKSQGKFTYAYKDPYHYRFDSLEQLALETGWQVEAVKDFDHPKGQSMLCFRPSN